MTADARRQAIEKIDAIAPTIEGNREMLAWLRGERQRNDDDEKRHRRVRIIDFEAPGENAFHVTWEWTLKPPAQRQPRRCHVMI